MKIKVCHFTSVHPWDDIRIYQKMCVSLAKNENFEVFLIAPNADEGKHNGVNVINVEKESDDRLYRFYKLRKKVYLKALALNADIYHFHDPELIPYGLKLQKKGKKVIFDSHEDVPNDILDKEWINPNLLRKLISSFYNLYEKNTTIKLSGVISVLDQITNKFKNKNLLTIHNYPKIEEFESNVESKISLPEKFNVVYNGGLTKIRGIDVMIDAMKYLDDEYRLILMGNWESAEYEKMCKSSEGWEKVIYLGNIPTKECFNLLQQCQLGIILFKAIPNHINSLPNKSFEFIAAKIPILMSDFDFWKDEFKQYANFTSPDKPDEVAENIKKIKSNYLKEIEKVNVHSPKILTEKNWKAEAEKLVKFYHKIYKS